jgi:voltage-gated potassium channel
MSTAAKRVRAGAAVLAAVILIAVPVYRFAGTDHDWIESLWFVVITVSSVGLAEESELSPALQVFTVLLIVFGLSAAMYTFGGFIQMMTEGEVERALGRRRMTQGIERLTNHVILCGFGRIGNVLARELVRQAKAFVVVDNDPEVIEEATASKYLVVTGEAAEETTLIAAGVERAAALVSSLPSDADNVFITLTARNLNSEIKIITRAEFPSSQKKLKQAGADRVVMPSRIGAHRMARMITRPTTANLMERVIDDVSLEIEMDEIRLPAESRLVGVTVANAEAHRRHGLLFVAVEHADEQMLFNPGGDYTFQPADIVIVMGRPEDIKRFREQYEL